MAGKSHRVRVFTTRPVASFEESEVRLYPPEAGKLGEGYLSSAAFRMLPPKIQDPQATKQFDLHFPDGSVARGCQMGRGAFGDGAVFTYWRLDPTSSE